VAAFTMSSDVLALCAICKQLMNHDYCCRGCHKSIHWFCSEGDTSLNESYGHVAHYCCPSCYSRKIPAICTPRQIVQDSTFDFPSSSSPGTLKKVSFVLAKERIVCGFTDIPCMLSPRSPRNELANPSHAVNTSNSPTAKRVYPSGILSKQSPCKCGTQKINASKAVGKKHGAKGNTSVKLSRKSPHEVAPQTLLSKKYNNERAARKRLSKKSLLMEVSYPLDDGEDSQEGKDAIPRNVGEESKAGEDAIPRNVGEESEAGQDEIIHEASEAGITHVPVEDHGMLNSQSAFDGIVGEVAEELQTPPLENIDGISKDCEPLDEYIVDDFDNQETDYFCTFEQQPEEDHNVIYPMTTQTAAFV